MLKIIGIIGGAKSGKSTLANFINEVLEFDWEMETQIVELSNVLKTEHPQKPGQSKEDWRKLLQKIGENRRKEFGDTNLIELVHDHFKAGDYSGTDFIVLSDLRLHSEAEYLQKNMNGFVINLVSRYSVRRKRSDDPDKFDLNSQDRTEQESLLYKNADLIIPNDEDNLNWLRKMSMVILENIKVGG